MSPKIAIVGGGVSASLAVKLFAPNNDVTLFLPTSTSMSAIPEIVPRQEFFRAAQINSKVEIQIIAEAASHLQWFWYSGDKHILSSTDQYFVYDKQKLTSSLLKVSSRHTQIFNDVTEIDHLKGFSSIFDCRGFNAATKDPAYQIHDNEDALTCCTYIVVALPEYSSDTMSFWSEVTIENMNRTFFVIPLGNNRVSIGCSYLPKDFVCYETLLGAVKQKGIKVSKSDAIFSGIAKPSTSVVTSLLPHVKPLGDTSERPCPIREYGTMKALSQISLVSGSAKLQREFIERPTFEEIDPHIPMELI